MFAVPIYRGAILGARRASVPLSPDQLPLPGVDLILDGADPSTVFYSDAGTTPVTTDGATLWRWQAVTGSPIPHLTKNNRAAMTLRVENGVRVGESPNNSSALDYTLARTNTALSMHFVFRSLSTATTFNGLASFGANQGSPQLADRSGVNTGGMYYAVGVTSANQLTAYIASLDTQWHCLSFVYDGAAASLRTYFDGAEIGPGQNAGVPVPTGAAALASWNQVQYSVGHVMGQATNKRYVFVGAYTAAHTKAQVESLHDWARTRYSALFGAWQSDPLVIWDGSSNLMEANAGLNQGLPTLCRSVGGYSREYTVVIPGSRTEQMTARIPFEMAKYLAGRTGKVVLMLFASGNDYATASPNPDAATLYARLGEFAAAARSYCSQLKVIAIPWYSRGNFPDAVRDPANTLLMTDAANYFDYVVGGKGNSPASLDPLIWGANACANATYFLGDQIHTTAAGNAVVAPYVRTQMALALA